MNTTFNKLTTLTKTSKKKSFFKLRNFFIISFVVIFLGSVFLWIYLKDYENSSPDKIMNNILCMYQNKNTSEILKLDTTKTDIDKKIFFNNFEKEIDNKNIFAYQSSMDDDTISYSFINKNKKLSQLKLKKSGKKSFFHFPKYKINSLEHFPQYNIKINAPETAEISVDGILLNKKTNTEKNSTSVYKQINMPEYNILTYSIETIYKTENISATDEKKTKYKVFKDKDFKNVNIETVIDDDFRNKVKSLSENFTKDYMYFATRRNAPKTKVLSYIANGSKLRNTINLYSNVWNAVYTQDEFIDLSVHNIVVLSDKQCYSDVSTDYKIITNENVEKIFPFCYRLYFANIDGNWKIVEMDRENKDSIEENPQS